MNRNAKVLYKRLNKIKRNCSGSDFRSIVINEIQSKYRIHDLEEKGERMIKHPGFDFLLKKNQGLVNLIQKGEIHSKKEKQVFWAAHDNVKTFNSIQHFLDFENEKIKEIGRRISRRKYEYVYDVDLQPVSSLTKPGDIKGGFLIASCFDLVEIGVEEIMSNLFYRHNYRLRKVKV